MLRGLLYRPLRRLLKIPSPSRLALGLEPDVTWAKEQRERPPRKHRKDKN